MIITDVAIDLDGVAYPFSKAFKKYCESVLGYKNLQEPTRWEFYEDWGMTKVEFMRHLKTASKDHSLFSTEEPMQGVKSAWKLLKAANITTHVVTARPHTAWASTADWLHKHEIIPDHLHFTHDKTVISHVSKGACAAIDDYTVYYDELVESGVFTVLHSQPWNLSHIHAKRVDSLYQFATILYKLNCTKDKKWQKQNDKNCYKTPSIL